KDGHEKVAHGRHCSWCHAKAADDARSQRTRAWRTAIMARKVHAVTGKPHERIATSMQLPQHPLPRVIVLPRTALPACALAHLHTIAVVLDFAKDASRRIRAQLGHDILTAARPLREHWHKRLKWADWV